MGENAVVTSAFANIHQLQSNFSTIITGLCININSSKCFTLGKKKILFAFFLFPPVTPFSSYSQTHTSNYSSGCHIPFPFPFIPSEFSPLVLLIPP